MFDYYVETMPCCCYMNILALMPSTYYYAFFLKIVYCLVFEGLYLFSSSVFSGL